MRRHDWTTALIAPPPIIKAFTSTMSFCFSGLIAKSGDIKTSQ